MTAPRIASLVAALLLTASVDLIAQQQTVIGPNARIRVTAPNIDRVVGTVISIGTDTCVLAVGGRAEPLTLPLASMQKLEVSRGYKSRIGRGILIGAGIGAAVGVIVGAAACSDGCYFDDNGEELSQGAAAAVFGVAIAFGGAGAGALVGALTKVERWEAVPLHNIRVGLTPHRGPGLVVSVSVAF